MGIILGRGRRISNLDGGIKYKDGEMDKGFITLTSFQQRYSISYIFLYREGIREYAIVVLVFWACVEGVVG